MAARLFLSLRTIFAPMGDRLATRRRRADLRSGLSSAIAVRRGDCFSHAWDRPMTSLITYKMPFVAASHKPDLKRTHEEQKAWLATTTVRKIQRLLRVRRLLGRFRAASAPAFADSELPADRRLLRCCSFSPLLQSIDAADRIAWTLRVIE